MKVPLKTEREYNGTQYFHESPTSSGSITTLPMNDRQIFQAEKREKKKTPFGFGKEVKS